MSESLPEQWVERTKAAKYFGVGIRQFDERHRKLLPESAIRKADNKVYVDFPKLIKAYIEQETKPVSGGDDPMLAGGSSPALEQYRAAKARLAEMDVAKRKGELANVSDMEKSLGVLCDALRRGVEFVQRKFGNGPADPIRESVDNYCYGL